jgi:hypothetical protein
MSISPSMRSEVGARTRSTLWFARRGYRKLFGSPNVVSYYEDVSVTGQAASNLIRRELERPGPAMIARFGSGELSCVANYLGIFGDANALRRATAYVTGRGGALWWEERLIDDLVQVAGFFPRDTRLVERFAARMLDDMACVDVLGSWVRWERLVASRLPHATRVALPDLEPYYHRDPWTPALEGRTVLVVHPFAESIRRQYGQRELLFADPRVLPEFELKTLPSVQSIGETPTQYSDWFAALDAMCDAMSRIDWDVAIIGAGAYGFCLAAHAKRLGRKAVHLGGATQILFGIRGRRWDEDPNVSRFYNDAWVRATPNERPANYLRAEGGSYW